MTYSLTVIVRKLTFPNLAGVIAVGILWPLASVGASATRPAPSWHPIEEIQSAAEEYIRLTVGRDDARVMPSAGHLDSRLQLPHCGQDLAPYLPARGRSTGRIIVGVRCQGDRPWNIFLPVNVAVMEDVIVSAAALPLGHRVMPEDLVLRQRDVSGLTGGYLTDPEVVVGQLLRRPIARGIVMTRNQLTAPVMIRKGQAVTLSIENGSIAIRMSGKALMNGAVNERIRVQNADSGRVVEGIVRSNEVVQIVAH